ncbi:MAG: hypothetical protein GH144_00385 [Clostridia bacterium]|nr:hypothetical protein [Clostridia bacterium]
MIAKRIYRMMTCFLIFALLMLNLFVAAALAQDLSEAEIEKIEEIITTFASDPELGMNLLKDLAEENPELAILAIVGLAQEIPEKAVMAIVSLAEINPKVAAGGLVAIGQLSIELAETQPKLAAILKAVLSQSITGMVESGSGRGAGVAAVVVQSCKEIDPGLGESLEEEAVAAGLERSYLLAASPIMP